MSGATRLVVCLDVKGGRVVKGVRFQGLRDLGDPVELAERYEREGADEIVFLDVSASSEERGTLLEVVRRTAERLFIPLTVGGGISSVDDVARVLRAGADKVAINSAGVKRPELFTEVAAAFGAQCVVASIDARREGEVYRVLTHGGSRETGLDAVAWAQECVRRGAGEVLLTSIDRDGTGEGYDVKLLRAVAGSISVPLVASGGAGTPAHLVAAVREGGADAVLVAGMLHDGRETVGGLKRALAQGGVSVRPSGGQGLMEAVATVARLTAAEALRFFKAELAVESKGDGTPVTLADRSAEQRARAWIAEHFPEDGIVGEELGTVNPGAKRRWFVDPIDGTKAFIRGVPLWGTLVGVAEGEEVLAGAMVFPALGEELVAERGRGCFFNGVRAQVSKVASLGQATVLTTDLAHPGLAAGLAAQAKVARTWGDCYGYLLVATGRAEVMVDPVMSPWDAVALQPILEEAGGVFTDALGRRTAFGGSVIASNAALAQVVRARPAAPAPFELDRLDFSKGAGLVTVVTQDARSGEVLMVAHADREALALARDTGVMHYRSRTRGLWRKGDTSGNTQAVVSLHLDCDGDAVLARVVPAGPACHTGAQSCFADAGAAEALGRLDATLAARAAAPPDGKSYTQKLLGDRNLRLKKLGEEAAELVAACCDADRARAAEEVADLLFHALVAVRPLGVGLDDVRAVLAARAK